MRAGVVSEQVVSEGAVSEGAVPEGVVMLQEHSSSLLHNPA